MTESPNPNHRPNSPFWSRTGWSERPRGPVQDGRQAAGAAWKRREWDSTTNTPPPSENGRAGAPRRPTCSSPLMQPHESVQLRPATSPAAATRRTVSGLDSLFFPGRPTTGRLNSCKSRTQRNATPRPFSPASGFGSPHRIAPLVVFRDYNSLHRRLLMEKLPSFRLAQQC